MRSKWILVCLLMLACSSGCSIYRHVSRPELWGLSLPESWDYDRLRHAGNSHAEARRILAERRASGISTPLVLTGEESSSPISSPAS